MLTGKKYSARLSPVKEQLDALRERHGAELEQWCTTSLVTPSTALLNRKLAIWKGPRMLKPSEIDLLRRSKKEMAEALRAMDAIEAERQSDST